MQKRKKVMLVLMASMMVAAAMSQARASEIGLEERLNTQGKIEAAMAGQDGEILMGDLDLTEGKIQATMMMMSKEEILKKMNEMFSEAEYIQSQASNQINANDELQDNPSFMRSFSGYGPHIELIGSKILEVESLNEDQVEEMIQAFDAAQESYGIIKMLGSTELRQIEENL